MNYGHGGARPGGGRKKGSKSRRTKEWEEFGRYFVDGDLQNVLDHQKRLWKEDPDKALENFFKGIEYFKPKLNRAELTGKDGKDLNSGNNVILANVDDKELIDLLMKKD